MSALLQNFNVSVNRNQSEIPNLNPPIECANIATINGNKLFQIFSNSILQTTINIGADVSTEKQTSLANKLTKVAEENGISCEEITNLLLNHYLKLDALLENEELITTFSRIMKKSLDSYEENFQNGSLIYFRDSFLKIISLAFNLKSIKKRGTIAVINGRKFIIRLKIKTEDIHAIDLDSVRLLNEGNYIKVFEAFDLFRYAKVALKTPKKNSLYYLSKLFHEKGVAKDIRRGQINNQLPLENVKSVPYAIIGAEKTKVGKKVIYYKPHFFPQFLIEELYGCDLYEKVNRWYCKRKLLNKDSSQKELAISRKLLQGLVAIHSAGYAHGDIKPENILLKKVNDNTVAHIADFGDASNLSMIVADEFQFRRNPIGVFSNNYVLPADLLREKNAGKIADIHEAGKLAIHYKQQRDVFAMGLVIAMVLSEIDPFDIERSNVPKIAGDDFPDLGKPKFEQRMLNFDTTIDFKPIIKLIWQMVERNPNKRLTAAKALQAFDEIDGIQI